MDKIEQAIEALRGEMNARFDKVDTRLVGVDTRLAGVEDELVGMNARLTGVEGELAGLRGAVEHLTANLLGGDEARRLKAGEAPSRNPTVAGTVDQRTAG